MSEEVTYADLKFQDSTKTENTKRLDKFGKKVPPVPSRVWRQTTWTLSLLCLLLLVGLVVLGIMFYLTLKIEMGKLNKLQNIEEELQRNVSVQLLNNRNSSEKIRSLSIALQNVATQLCRELCRKDPEHKCKPCPESWIWHKDRCYLLSDYYLTWQESDMFCSAQNASLLTMRSESELEFIKSKNLFDYWLGLFPRKDNKLPEKIENLVFPSARFIRNTGDLKNMYCGYIYQTYVYYTSCRARKKFLCQKMANPSLNIESILTSDFPDGGM
ncbi:C-type lectin domain family 12 member A [Lepus europaeus]|uniref:C-type lectin domain family 12 member A n=1 Tax=Lepus europaeus TaxID=9983 RepID=UPI002B49D988|nr:C-type lectin domain family 12 member A [Lepus europaeus]